MVRLRPVWMTNHPPSVLWHCWLGHQTCKNRRPYNLYCVAADVKSINQLCVCMCVPGWLQVALSTVTQSLVVRVCASLQGFAQVVSSGLSHYNQYVTASVIHLSLCQLRPRTHWRQNWLRLGRFCWSRLNRPRRLFSQFRRPHGRTLWSIQSTARSTELTKVEHVRCGHVERGRRNRLCGRLVIEVDFVAHVYET